MVCRVFICYRRDDTAACAGPLQDRLAARFGQRNVFLDQAIMRPGDQFPIEIVHAIRDSHVMLTLIGTHWLGTPDAGAERRLDDRADWVRREILLAWKHGVRVMPVLVDGAVMPSRSDLPRRLARLGTAQAIDLRTGAWPRDVTHLIEQIEEHVREQRRGRFGTLTAIRKEAPLPHLVANACRQPANLVPAISLAAFAWYADATWVLAYAVALYVASVSITLFDLKQAKKVGRRRMARPKP